MIRMQTNFKQSIKIESSKYDAEANRYLNLIKYSDDSLKQLTSYFEKCKEPTIILFLGDHQPRLTDEFMNKITNGKYTDLEQRTDDETLSGTIRDLGQL